MRLPATRSGYGRVMERSHEMVCETETAAEVREKGLIDTIREKADTIKDKLTGR